MHTHCQYDVQRIRVYASPPGRRIAPRVYNAAQQKKKSEEEGNLANGKNEFKKVRRLTMCCSTLRRLGLVGAVDSEDAEDGVSPGAPTRMLRVEL